MEKNAKIFIGVVVLLVVGIAITAVVRGGGGTSSQGPGKYDEFATCLADKGSVFYGAFWCSHCKAQKKLFGSSQKLLPYVECSLPSGQGQVQACTDKKIESYPTWEFPTPIKITSALPPIFCAPAPGVEGEPKECAKSRSPIFKVWIFQNALVASDTDPIHTGDEWSFVPGSQLRGEISLQELSNQTSCILPG